MDRPILFSAPMVRAIIDGKKTMTRRIYKPSFDKWQVGDRLWVRETYLDYTPCDDNGELISDKTVVAYRADEDDQKTIDAQLIIDYGRDNTISYGVENTKAERIVDRWKPSIFMPRELSRITLEITELKSEFLQDISEADARREGVEDMIYCDLRKIPIEGNIPHSSYRQGFRYIFEKINGHEVWEQNPLVLAISFKVKEVKNDL